MHYLFFLRGSYIFSLVGTVWFLEVVLKCYLEVFQLGFQDLTHTHFRNVFIAGSIAIVLGLLRIIKFRDRKSLRAMVLGLIVLLTPLVFLQLLFLSASSKLT